MPITLADAKLNTLEDYDPAIIDEFRKNSPLLDALIFDTAVNPAGGGATLEYGYRRLVTQRGAEFREIGKEYTPQEVKTVKKSVELKPLGGTFEVDRVLAHLGPAASDEVALQTSQLIKATNAKFNDAIITGDTALAILDDLDELLGALDGPPTLLLCNKRVLAKIRAAARRANLYTQQPVEGLLGVGGHEITREMLGNVILADAGEKAGTNDPVIPVTAGKTSIYAVRIGLDGFHGVTTTDGQMLRTWLPDFSTSGAVKRGEVELGPVAPVLKSTRAAAVLRNVKIGA